MLYIIMFIYIYNGKKLICYNRGGNGRAESIPSFDWCLG